MTNIHTANHLVIETINFGGEIAGCSMVYFNDTTFAFFDEKCSVDKNSTDTYWEHMINEAEDTESRDEILSMFNSVIQPADLIQKIVTFIKEHKPDLIWSSDVSNTLKSFEEYPELGEYFNSRSILDIKTLLIASNKSEFVDLIVTEIMTISKVTIEAKVIMNYLSDSKAEVPVAIQRLIDKVESDAIPTVISRLAKELESSRKD